MKKTFISLTVVNVLLVVFNITQPAVADVWADLFDLKARTYVTAFPVPSFTPTEPGKVIALDVYPSVGAVENPDNGYAWVDACDKNLMNAYGDVPVACARMGIKSDRVEFGSRNFDGSPEKDIYIVRNRQVIAKFDATGMTVYGTVRAKQFENIP